MMKAGCSGRRCACLPVYIESRILLCSQIENLAHLRWSLDFARIARHPGRMHRLLRDAVEMLGPDLDLAQAARHAKATNEAVEHVAGILAGMAHRGGDQRLTLGIDGFVPAHHER